jgi:hypothetical protein
MEAVSGLAKGVQMASFQRPPPSARPKSAAEPDRWRASAERDISQPGDAHEHAADRLATHALDGSMNTPARTAPPTDAGEELDPHLRSHFEQRLGFDFRAVRIHAGTRAHALADQLDAAAFAMGTNIWFGRDAYQPSTATGRGLLAHELAHVAVGGGQSSRITRKTKGERIIEDAHARWLDPDATVKAEVDVIKVALRNAKKGKAVQFNAKAGRTRISSALRTLGKTATEATVHAEWDALIKDRANAGKPAYVRAESAFFSHFKSPLAALAAAHPKQQTKYWLKNTPPQVLDSIIAAATPDLPPVQLWAYAFKEGTDKYVRHEIGLTRDSKAEPTEAQLAGVSTKKAVSGFDFIGIDDFFTDLRTKKEPLSKYLPSGFLSKVTLDERENEHHRIVKSAKAADLTTAFQAMAAMLRRRRALFLADQEVRLCGAHHRRARLLDIRLFQRRREHRTAPEVRQAAQAGRLDREGRISQCHHAAGELSRGGGNEDLLAGVWPGG